ncbi:hypothetical protein POW79_19780 [Enterobacter quasiroggenkampii]|uniref:hypothetical protein n=1 Tax=Enterobacter quasiroggenkampii TaxID=2497436 RepID=UPI002FFAFF37
MPDIIYAIYEWRRSGNIYLRLADGTWYCRFVREGVDDYPCRSSHWIVCIAGTEVTREYETRYQQRLKLLPSLRVHWQPIATALGRDFTDAELLRLDEVPHFQGLYQYGFLT